MPRALFLLPLLLPACGIGLCINNIKCTGLTTVFSGRLAFTGDSHPSNPLSVRFFDETNSWLLTGDCNVELGDVIIGGDLTAPKTTPCNTEDGGTFSVSIAYLEFDTAKHTYGRKSVTIAQTGVESLSTYLYQSHTSLTVIEVSTPAQLQAMVTSDPNRMYVLTDDIDLAEVSATNNWTPLNNFQGVIEGNGHQIANLHVVSGAVEVGFLISAYNTASTTGSIQNLEFTNVNVTATAGLAGALAGATFGGGPHISNVHIQGNVSATAQAGGFIGLVPAITGSLVAHDISFTGNVSGAANTGGIFGELCFGCSGSATDVHFSGIVSGTNDVGGITGSGATTLNRGSVQGTVQGTWEVGGAVGWHGAFSEIAEVSVNATVIGTSDYVGGIAGYLRSPVRNCKSSGSVSGNNRVGGIGGILNFSSSAVQTSYTTMAVMGAGTNRGPVVGQVAIGSQSDNYFASSSSCAGCDNVLGTGLSALQLLQQASFTGFTFPSPWTVQEGVSSPKLAWE